MADLKNPNAIYLKGFLFLIAGFVPAGLIVARTFDWQIIVLLAICVWCFCRFYYFAFYVIEHYVDDGFRFSGLIDFVRYLLERRAR